MTKSYNTIFIKIITHKIREAKLRRIEIPNYQKIILLTAYYQINKRPLCQIFEFLNIAKTKNANNPAMLQLIKQLMANVKQKEFPKKSYQELLETDIEELASDSEALIEETTDNTFLQELDLLLAKEQYHIVIRLCSAPSYFNDASIQKRHIEALIKLNRLNDAIRLCMRPSFQNIPSIQTLLINILIELDRPEEALLICSQEYLKDSLAIQVLTPRVIALAEAKSQREAITAYYNDYLNSIEKPQTL